MPLRIAIVGPGRVGSAFGHRLAQRGCDLLGFIGPERAIEQALRFCGAGKALGSRLQSLATYLISEEEESKLWALASQCLSCLVRLRGIQEASFAQEVDVLYNIKTRVTMPRKEEPEAAPVETQEEAAAQLADLQERLRPYVGTDVLPEGNSRW